MQIARNSPGTINGASATCAVDNRCTMHRRDPSIPTRAHHASHAGKARRGRRMSTVLRLRPPTIVLSLLCAMYFLLFINRTNMRLPGH